MSLFIETFKGLTLCVKINRIKIIIIIINILISKTQLNRTGCLANNIRKFGQVTVLVITESNLRNKSLTHDIQRWAQNLVFSLISTSVYGNQDFKLFYFNSFGIYKEVIKFLFNHRLPLSFDLHCCDREKIWMMLFI